MLSIFRIGGSSQKGDRLFFALTFRDTTLGLKLVSMSQNHVQMPAFKILLTVLTLLLSSTGLLAQSHSPKFGYRLNYLMAQMAGNEKQPSSDLVKQYRLTQDVNGKWLVPIHIKGQVDVAGLKLGTQIGAFANATIPVKSLLKLAIQPGLVMAEAVNKMAPTMELERAETRANLVQSGSASGTPYDGSNVVVSILDVGFDYTHINFLDTLGQRNRIMRVWDQLLTTGTAPQGFNYGSEISSVQDLMALQSDSFTYFTHGAHTAGIAAGGGFRSNGFFKGIAPNADLIFVPTDFWSDHVLDAVLYSNRVAAQQGKRCVVNMSFGGWGGPMDGSDLFDQMLDSIIINSQPNPVVVASMGNEGEITSFIEHQFTSPADTFKTFLGFNRRSNFYNGEPQAQFWINSATPVNFRISIFDSTGVLKRRYNWHTTANNRPYFLEPFWKDGRDSFFVGIIIDTSYVTNGAQHILIHGKPWSLNHYLSVEIVGGAGSSMYAFNPFFQFWSAPGRFAQPVQGYKQGMRRNNYRSPGGTCRYTIGVGAYVSRARFINQNGQMQVAPSQDTIVGRLGEFSSRGPGLGNRTPGIDTKPSIVAPGRIVLSSLSNYCADDPAIVERVIFHNTFGHPYGGLSGTSMSAPMVSGAVALLLQAYPNMDAQSVLRTISSSGRHDQFTVNQIGHFEWGGGKLDIANAILNPVTSIDDAVMSGAKLKVYPNPTTRSFRIFGLIEKNNRVVVRNQLGQQMLVISDADSQTEYDTSLWPVGLYQVVIIGGQHQQTLKLMVQH